ncbi:hypothetical protein EV421DRAFT_1742758 [Armillaria borealis]|uniref:Uncharacterized protein n=1 Tax=Armillaria borealis TaxID=47425 RepID=A0AA39MEF3_9AGAR|nr:hypothetical protein EV421DRAFT_1742758 [Armillaria borealis]
MDELGRGGTDGTEIRIGCSIVSGMHFSGTLPEAGKICRVSVSVLASGFLRRFILRGSAGTAWYHIFLRSSSRLGCLLWIFQTRTLDSNYSRTSYSALVPTSDAPSSPNVDRRAIALSKGNSVVTTTEVRCDQIYVSQRNEEHWFACHDWNVPLPFPVSFIGYSKHITANLIISHGFIIIYRRAGHLIYVFSEERGSTGVGLEFGDDHGYPAENEGLSPLAGAQLVPFLLASISNHIDNPEVAPFSGWVVFALALIASSNAQFGRISRMPVPQFYFMQLQPPTMPVMPIDYINSVVPPSPPFDVYSESASNQKKAESYRPPTWNVDKSME